MNIGIVTTWFERGAAYVSKQFEEILAKDDTNKIFIYARGGEEYAVKDLKWNKSNVYWGTQIISPFSSTVISKKDFFKWIKKYSIDTIIFNEQHWFQPLLWCKELKIKTIAYIDYYTEETVPLFEIYDAIICNTKRHYSVFNEFNNAYYLPWGTDINLFKPYSFDLVSNNFTTFFHSSGWDFKRKGTDILLKAFNKTISNCKLVIHTQNEITRPDLLEIINKLTQKGRLEIIVKTVHAPGLYYMGDIYVYPTRLEGIGLTIAEAISSGLGVVLPNNGPMNEFATSGNSVLVNVRKFFSRSDGYYWPKCEIDIEELTEVLDDLANNPDKVIAMKRTSRTFAIEKLNANENLKDLNSIIKELEFKELRSDIRNKITRYDNKGFKRFHKYYLRFYPFFNFIRKN